MDPAETCYKPRSAAWIRVSTVAVAACVVASAFGEYSSGSRGGLLALEIAVGLVAIPLVPLLFRRPVLPALALAALAAVAPTATPAATIGTLQVARMRPVRVAVGVAVAGIAGHLVRFLWIPTAGLPFGWWVLLVVFAHAALVGWGLLGAARGALIASLKERAERAEAGQGRRVAEARAAERAAIAREMHDVLAHRLSLLATYAGALEYRPDAPPERMSAAAGVIRSSAHQALDELRDVITLLNDDPAEDEPDHPVPALSDLPGLVAETRAVGTPVEVRDEVADAAVLPGRTGRTAYRVLQEALTNARKHAPGQPVSIALDGTPGARLVIDVRNALPREPVAVPAIPGAGRGLLGLTERVRLAGGQLDHAAGPGEFRLHAWLPWPT
ncbi:MAG TPA: histidine kinase [Actinophytocola sp.]|nr:histidine kinase [Actinophytocola sp.]